MSRAIRNSLLDGTQKQIIPSAAWLCVTLV